MTGDGGDASSAKRKRDESHERRASSTTKERRTKVRQERMEDEFAETFQGVTALYKTLEMMHLHSPLFLPRTLCYRLDPEWKKEGPSAVKKSMVKAEGQRYGDTARAPAGAAMMGVKVGMRPDTMEAFNAANYRQGLFLSIYTAKGRSFAENQFSLLATCLIKLPCKEVRLPREFLRPQADMCVMVFQLVDIADEVDSLAQSASSVFTEAPKTETGAAPTVSGKDLLTASANGRTPLYANLLSLNAGHRRMGYVTVDLSAIGSSVQGGVKCEFRMTWEPLSKAKKMARLAKVCNSKLKVKGSEVKSSETFVLDIPKRDIMPGSAFKPCQGVWFHFLYHLKFRRMSEKRSEYSCAWCNMFAGSLRGLVAHLVASHDRFRFQATVGHDNIPHIYVTVVESNSQRLASAGSRSVLCELELNSAREPDRFEQAFEFVSLTKYGPHGAGLLSSGEAFDGVMQEFDEMDELSQEQPEEFYAPLLQRQYFHSRTGAVVLDHEKDYDSDDDVDESWITKQSERLLDEFEDVSLEEKEFMKKWNRHVKEFPILADFMAASSCRMFARNHGKWLLDHGLRHNFLLHLLNLWDNSLLNSRAIIDCMVIVDHCSEENAGTEVKEDGANAKTATNVAAQ